MNQTSWDLKAEELTESYINGNISYVRERLKNATAKSYLLRYT
jgi:hypothetical protein